MHCKREAHDIYIARPEPWKNPFRITNENQLGASVEKFRAWGERQRWLIDAARRELAGATLGCWCAPQACHGDVKASWANAPQGEPG